MVNCWFGARWFGFRLDPRKWKGLLLSGIPIRIPNHRAPNQQLTTGWKMQKQKTKNTSQVPQTVDSSNEGPEDFRHQLPHLFFFTFTEQSQEMSSYIWDGDPHYPETLNCGAKNPEKKNIPNCNIIPQFYGGGGKPLRICGGYLRPNKSRPKNTKTPKKWPQNIGTPMSFLTRCYAYMGPWFTSCGTWEVFFSTREMRVAEVQADQQKVPPNIGESLRIFNIFQHRSKPSGHRCLR